MSLLKVAVPFFDFYEEVVEDYKGQLLNFTVPILSLPQEDIILKCC